MTLTAIRLDGEIFPNYKTLEADNALTNLSRINIFIGANNAGKSRLMRTIFSNASFQFQRGDCDLDELNDSILEFHNQMAKAMSTGDSITIPLFIDKANYKYLTQHFNIGQDIYDRFSTLNQMPRLPIVINDSDGLYDLERLYSGHQIFGIINWHKQLLKEKGERLQTYNKPFTKTYIPILRGLRPIHSSDEGTPDPFFKTNSYLHRTIFDYFQDNKELVNEYISTGLDFYDELHNLKMGDVLEQELVKEFEDFLSETFFQNQTIVITPHARKDVVTFRIGKGEAHPIYDLGDGIQAIILLTYPLFFNKGKDMIFFFEEPEIYLHPGFQRIFIDTLLSDRFTSFQYFFSTHSNHFLDITLDHDNISIYNFRKEKSDSNTFLIENVQCGDNSLLEELGVRNASVFLSNCTIWVEGISDRIYIRKYLEVLIEKKVKEANLNGNTEGVYFREDYHYSFVEYSGNNITHWSFLDDADSEVTNINVDRICKRIFLVTDQDGAGEVKDGVKKKKKPNISGKKN